MTSHVTVAAVVAPAAAQSLYEESLSIRRDPDDRYGIADYLELMARLAARELWHGLAAVPFSAAEALRESIPVALATPTSPFTARTSLTSAPTGTRQNSTRHGRQARQ